MGQKVNPLGLRLGINRTWDSRWYSGKNEYSQLLHEDMKIRKELMKDLKQAAVSKIVIERPHKKCRVTVQSARPGVVIGKKGADIEKLRRKVTKLTKSDVVINIVEIRKPELDAQLVAESIAQQLERRVAFRRAMKRAVQSAMRLGAGGIRINCSGRLGGAEIARMEWYREGRVPLHTLRADVDYGVATAFTTYGTCGVKVWIFKGEIMEHDPMAQDKKMAEGEAGRRALTRHMKRAGRVWIRIYPDVPVSKKPLEVRMGSGKGAPELWVTRVKPGRILFEVDGVSAAMAREALGLAAAKLPIKTRFIERIAE